MLRKLAFVTVLALTLTSPARGAVWLVDQSATGNNTGTTWADAFTRLQDALQNGALQDGDEIWIAAGTYHPTDRSCTNHTDCTAIAPGATCGSAGECVWPSQRTPSFDLEDSVSLYGGFAPGGCGHPPTLSDLETCRNSNPANNNTILSGDLNDDDAATLPEPPSPLPNSFLENSYNVITVDPHRGPSDAAHNVLLDGFTIEGGIANGSSAIGASVGGGLQSKGNRVTVRNTRFVNNFGSGSGGAVHMHWLAQDEHLFDRCSFVSNRAIDGGAIYNADSTGPLSQLRIRRSTFTSNAAFLVGGAVANVGANLELVRCDFVQNHARDGGAYWENGSGDAFVGNCRFLGNSAVGGGGGAINVTNVNAGKLTIVNSLASGNTSTFNGGAVRLNAGVLDLRSSTIGNNRCTNFDHGGNCRGAGLFKEPSTTADITNSIFWDNSDTFSDNDTSEQVFYSTLTFSCVQNGPTGNGNTNFDPAFMDASGLDDVFGSFDDNYRLQIASPCSDTGNDAQLSLNLAWTNSFEVNVDLEDKTRVANDPKILGIAVDMGAYEAFGTPAPSGVAYVRKTATQGARTGGSWQDAYLYLQDALLGIDGGPLALVDEIWVASGTYYPTEQSCNVATDCDGGAPNSCVGGACQWSEPRTQSFRLISTAGVYGGFSGSETRRESRVFGCEGGANADWPCGTSADCPGGTCKNPTILSGAISTPSTTDNSNHVIYATQTSSNATRLEGITVRDGYCNIIDSSGYVGAGLFIEQGGVRLSKCRFDSNSASHSVSQGGGGGLGLGTSGVAHLINCVFQGNYSQNGGAIYARSTGTLQASDVRLLDNEANQYGGAVFLEHFTPALFDRCLFENNRTVSGLPTGHGGAITKGTSALPDVGILRLKNCKFVRNQASGSAGAIRLSIGPSGGAVYADSCLFFGNVAEASTGGIQGNQNDSMYLSNCVFVGNHGKGDSGAILGGGPTQIFDSTIVANQCSGSGDGGRGAGISIAEGCPTCEHEIYNSIVFDNESSVGDPDVYDRNTPDSLILSGNIIGASWPGVGNQTGPPEFIRNPSRGTDNVWGTTDDDYGDLRIASGSTTSGIDAGHSGLIGDDRLDMDADGKTFVETTPFDAMGLRRIQGLSVDVGAYETRPDCQNGGIGYGVPDDCDINCEASPDCPTGCGLAEDCNENGIPDECDIGSAPVPSNANQEIFTINSNAATDGNQVDEVVRIGKQGSGPWVATWITHASGGKDAVVATSDDFGQSWSAPVEFGVPSGCNHLPGDEYWPRIAGDGAGRWMVVFQSYTDSAGGVDVENDIFYSITDDGIVWSCPVEIATNSQEDQAPWVVSTAPGEWLVSWSRNGISGTDFDLVFSKVNCTSYPCTWTPPAPVHPAYATTDSGNNDDLQSRIMCGSARCVLVWTRANGSELDIYWSETTDLIDWSMPAPIASYAGTLPGYDHMPEIATDGADNWIVVWTSRVILGGGVGTDQEIFSAYRVSGDAGWTTVVVNYDAPSDGVLDDVAPTIAADDHGNWLCAWGKSDGATGNDIVVARSRNRGTTWSARDAVLPSYDVDDSTACIANDGSGNWMLGWQSVNTLSNSIGNDLDILQVRWRESGDCNSDGALDECELINGTPDINGDLKPDSCDCLGTVDSDGDGYDDECDNCPSVYNPSQTNSDAANGDYTGDECDLCPNSNDSVDLDADGVPDGCDNCPETYNPANLVRVDCNSDGDKLDFGSGEDIGDQCDRDGDDIGDLCDVCPDDANESCGLALGIGAMLLPPCAYDQQIAIENAIVEVPVDRTQTNINLVTSWTTQHSAVFFHPMGIMPNEVCCQVENSPGDACSASAEGGAWFAAEPGLVRVRWYTANNVLLGQSYYNVPNVPAPNIWTVGVRYFLDYNEDQFDRNADAVIDTPYYSTVRYNSTILAGDTRQIPGSGTSEQNPAQYYQFPDFRIESGRVVAEDYCPTGKVLIQYDDGPEGNLVGFEVVDISRRGTPIAEDVSVGRRLRLPSTADDCRAVLINNASVGGVSAGWQRGVDSADVYPIRPEANPSNFVVAWYKASNSDLPNGVSLGNCWPEEIGRYRSDWPSDPQTHVVAAGEDVVPEGAKVDLNVGAGERYCGAEILYQAGFRTTDAEPESEVVNGIFSASQPGFSVLRLDIDPPGLPACGEQVTFEVIASHDHRDVDQYDCIVGIDQTPPCVVDNDCGTGGICAPRVFKGTFPWAIGQQITDKDHDPEAEPFDYGFIKSGQPYAPAIYAETGQVIPVNSSAQHGPLEVWWYQEGRDCRCEAGTCRESGALSGLACSDDDSCGCTGNFAPGIYWPHRVGEYNAVWPPNNACACVAELCVGAGNRNSDSCTTSADCDCEALGEIVIASRLGGAFTDMTGAVVPKDFNDYAQLYGDGNFSTRTADDAVSIGWNPNDEHAILLPIGAGLRAFAVRDDNPWGVSSGHPYTLVQYPSSGNLSSPDLYDIDVFHVRAEETGVGTCDVDMCDGGLNDGQTCTTDPDCDFPLDYDFFIAQNNTTVRIPVVAGQPINPLFPVNFASPLCEDDGVPPFQLTFVDGDALWQDRKGGVWAVEAQHDGVVFDYGICREGFCVGGSAPANTPCMTDAQCPRFKNDDSIPEHSTGSPSNSDIFLWENWAADYSCQPWRAFEPICVGGFCIAGSNVGDPCGSDAACVPAEVHGFCSKNDPINNSAELQLCKSGDNCGAGSTCQYPFPIRYRPNWPEVPPDCRYPEEPGCARPLNIGESVDQSGQCGQIHVLHDSVGLRVLDPSQWVSTSYPTFEIDSQANLDALPPHLINGEIGGGGEFPDRIRYNADGRRLLEFRGIMSDRDYDLLRGLSTVPAYIAAIDYLRDKSDDQVATPITDSASKFVTVGDFEAMPGWITVAYQNDTRCIEQGLPVSVEVWNVQCPPFQSSIRVIQPECVFSEQQVLQFAGDLGGEPENLYFQWQYSVDYEPSDPEGATWINYNPPQGPDGCSDVAQNCYRHGKGLREIIIEGASEFTLGDSWWRVRYQGYDGCPCTPGVLDYPMICSSGCNADGFCVGGLQDGSTCQHDSDCFACSGGAEHGSDCRSDDDCSSGTCATLCCPERGDDEEEWAQNLSFPINQPSPWTKPQLAEGWVKRVVRGLNPFDQRFDRFHEAPAATYVHMIQQAGKRFEQDIALNCEPSNINNIGLIEAYETVLKRAKAFTIDVGTSYRPATEAILLAAGKVVDLYMLLGNEAYADAVDPTVGLFVGQGEEPQGYDPHAMFCFEDQVASLLEEELALLRGIDTVRDPDYDFDNHMIATVYNRLPWNFTSGAGQIAYANNYQFTDVEQALETFPQGHGDAWGHYLTATKKLYDLLRHDVFDWYVFTESVLVAGQPVEVGYKYERRFAEASAAKARTGASIVSQTFRSLFDALPSSQQSGYRDSDPGRAWGVIDWGQRAGQAAYLDWVTANSLLDDNAIDAVCSNTNTNCLNDSGCQGTCNLQTGFCANNGNVACTTDANCGGLCQPLAASKVCARTGLDCTTSCDCCCSISGCDNGFCNGGQRHGLSCSVDVDCGASCPAQQPCACDECVPRNDEYICSTNGVACSSDLDCPGERCLINTAFATSIRRIDRTTVAELGEISASFTEIQTVLDQVDTGLNPLGLTANVVPFGISPRLLEEGETHFDQVFKRAVTSLSNAVTAFDYANESTRRLRRVQDEVDQFDDLIEERELDYTARLIEIFGRPYAEDIGPGLAYPPGYYGPDVYHYDYVDDNKLIPLNGGSNVVVLEASFEEPITDPITGEYSTESRNVQFHVSTDGLGLRRPEEWEDRPEPGEIQFARAELLQAMGRFQQALDRYEAHIQQVEHQADLLISLTQLNADVIQIQRQGQAEQRSLNQEILVSRSLVTLFRTISRFTEAVADAGAECGPKVIGFITGMAGGVIYDPSFALRCSSKSAGASLSKLLDVTADAQVLFELVRQHDKEFASAQQQIQITGVQGDYQVEQQVEALRQLVRQTPSLRLDLYLLEESIKQASGRYDAAIGKGLRLLEQRTAFRSRTADQITQHRYRDMAFRVFRNEALQKYQAQFDLAARYAFLAAQAYDYESNLLRTDQLSGQQFLAQLSAERSLGMLQGGAPIVGNGLAGMLAQMGLNFDLVIRPQLGFNAPAEFDRTFSLRWELFRIPQGTLGDPAWRDVLTNGIIPADAPDDVTVQVVNDINNVFELPEYSYYCKPLQSENVPVSTRALVISFGTKVFSGLNLFGLASQGDEVYPSTYDTIKLRRVGVRFTNYPTGVLNNQAEIYLVPVGSDVLRVPTDGSLRYFELLETTLPQPFPLSVTSLQRPDWIPPDELVGGSQAMLKRRLHPQITALPAQGHSDDEDLRSDLAGRSVWNTKWVLIIPESELRGVDANGLAYFAYGPTGTSPGVGVRDIRLIFDSYGYIGGPILRLESSEVDAE